MPVAEEKLTLWTLNASKNLVNNDKIARALRKSRRDIVFGNRDVYTEDTQYKRTNIGGEETQFTHNLMCEVPSLGCDEYFFPIIPKCIGNLFSDTYRNQPRFDGCFQRTQTEKLSEIVGYAKHLHPNQPTLNDMLSDHWIEEYWKKGCGPNGRIKMSSELGVGYYEMLVRNYVENERKSVLIGYSQGGTVARYLAYLDEHVFKVGCIEAVITIQAANYGSPVASPRNLSHANECLQKAVSVILGTDGFSTFNTASLGGLTIENLVPHLDNYLADLEKTTPTSSIRPQDQLVLTARKWVSGFVPDDKFPTAFADLDPSNLNQSHSVLYANNEHALTNIKFGAIVASNDRVVPDIWDIFPKDSLLTNLDNKLAKLHLIAQKLFIEQPDEGPLSRELQYLKSEYLNPTEKDIALRKLLLQPKKIIPVKSHDLIIPAIYQLLPRTWAQREDEQNLGQYLNHKANHDTGKDPLHPAGQININVLSEILEDL